MYEFWSKYHQATKIGPKIILRAVNKPSDFFEMPVYMMTLLPFVKRTVTETNCEIQERPHTIASGCEDGTVRLWTMLTGDCVHKLSGNSGAVSALTLTEMYIICMGLDDRLCIWERCKGHILHQMQLVSNFWQSLVFKPSDKIRKMRKRTCEGDNPSPSLAKCVDHKTSKIREIKRGIAFVKEITPFLASTSVWIIRHSHMGQHLALCVWGGCSSGQEEFGV